MHYPIEHAVQNATDDPLFVQVLPDPLSFADQPMQKGVVWPIIYSGLINPFKTTVKDSLDESTSRNMAVLHQKIDHEILVLCRDDDLEGTNGSSQQILIPHEGTTAAMLD